MKGPSLFWKALQEDGTSATFIGILAVLIGVTITNIGIYELSGSLAVRVYLIGSVFVLCGVLILLAQEIAIYRNNLIEGLRRTLKFAFWLLSAISLSAAFLTETFQSQMLNLSVFLVTIGTFVFMAGSNISNEGQHKFLKFAKNAFAFVLSGLFIFTTYVFDLAIEYDSFVDSYSSGATKYLLDGMNLTGSILIYVAVFILPLAIYNLVGLLYTEAGGIEEILGQVDN